MAEGTNVRTASDSASVSAHNKQDYAKMIARNMAARSAGEPKEPVYRMSQGVTDFGDYEDFDDDFDEQDSYDGYDGYGDSEPYEEDEEEYIPPARKKSSEETERKKRRKKAQAVRARIGVWASVLGVFALFIMGGVYIGGIKAYQGVFLDNTYINGVNVSGMSELDAYNKVRAKSVVPRTINITKKDGSVISIEPESLGYVDSVQDKITQYYSEQDHYKWISSKFKPTEFFIRSSFSYDKELLRSILKDKLTVGTVDKEPENAYIRRMDDGSYQIVSEVIGDSINPDKFDAVCDYIMQEIDAHNYDIHLGGLDIYKKPKIISSDLEDTCRQLNGVQGLEFTFDFFYATEKLTGDTIVNWVSYDEEAPLDGLEVDEDKVAVYVEWLSSKYDTFGKDREFRTTNRGVITIPQGQGCYGWWLDQEGMTDLIVDLIKGGSSQHDIEPIYYQNPYSGYLYTCNTEWLTPEKDFSDTYFEVDLSAQHMWYYEEGELKMESDIVSGYPNASRNTPAGVYKLWYKERGKTLTGTSDGYSYASYVEYWNNISTISIGFHDASWQNGIFGGTRYQSSTWGSHGCINLPTDKAKYIFDNCELGIPVFAYWSDGKSQDSKTAD
ncbi:MAG: peptidoglycan binding domain-containing protein [Ruminococcus sp.]|nr:peptidoglycan binding domain-containing protein [Ruminococcus sp.]